MAKKAGDGPQRMSRAKGSVARRIAELEANDIKKNQWLIDPRTSKRLPYWDGTSAFALLFTALVTPYEVAFLPSDLVYLFAINRCVDCIFVVDVVVQFFLAFPFDSSDEGGSRWVTDLPSIRRHYLRGWFAVDVLATGVSIFDIISFVSNNDSFSRLKALRVLRVLRLVKLLRLLRGARASTREAEPKLRAAAARPPPPDAPVSSPAERRSSSGGRRGWRSTMAYCSSSSRW